jgi:hypothetical protein
MPIVVNSNASATEASFNLSRANDALQRANESTHQRMTPVDSPLPINLALRSSVVMLSYRTHKMHCHTYKCKILD